LGSGPHIPDAPRPHFDKPFVPHVKSWEPCYFTEIPNGPQLMLLISSGSRKKEPIYACLSEAKDIHKECGPRFPLSLHTSYTVDGPAALVGEDVSSGCYVEIGIVTRLCVGWVLFMSGTRYFSFSS